MAVLNREDPLDFWRGEYPFDRIREVRIHLEHTDGRGEVTTMIIQEKQFREFMKKLKTEVEKDELIQYIWKEFDVLQGHIETYLFDELLSRLRL